MFVDSFAIVADQIVNERGSMFDGDKLDTNSHSHFESGMEYESLVDGFEHNERRHLKDARMAKGMRSSLRRG
jgi:hypothetical protein